MNNENEIERILEVMHSNIYLTHSDVAIALVNAGIGDKKQAVKEFVEKLKERLHHYVGKDGWTFYSVIYAHEIDNLITELYGADE